jgi:condensin complex subunit 1
MYLKKVNIQAADKGVKKMLVLVWSKDKSVKDEVISSYWNLFMDRKEFKSKKIAENLISLLNDTNLTE